MFFETAGIALFLAAFFNMIKGTDISFRHLDHPLRLIARFVSGFERHFMRTWLSFPALEIRRVLESFLMPGPPLYQDIPAAVLEKLH
jgi:hypothetical protein